MVMIGEKTQLARYTNNDLVDMRIYCWHSPPASSLEHGVGNLEHQASPPNLQQGCDSINWDKAGEIQQPFWGSSSTWALLGFLQMRSNQLPQQAHTAAGRKLMISREEGYASINKGTCQRKQPLSPKQKGAAVVHVHSAQGQQHLNKLLYFMALDVLTC